MSRLLKLSLALALLSMFVACQDGGEPPPESTRSPEAQPQLTREQITMLEMAAKGDTAAVKDLLDKGVDVNMRGLDRNTPIMEAAFAGHLETVKLLLNNGADLSAQKNDGATVVTLDGGHAEIGALFKDVASLVNASSRGDNKVIEELISKGTPVNGLDQFGHSALSEAAWNGRTQTVKLLLDKGANPNIKKSDGQSPLELATGQGHKEIVALLNEAIAKHAKEKPAPTGK